MRAGRRADVKVPAWLNDVTLYHNRGNTTFAGENSQYGDFFGLDDLFTENPQVVDGMIDIYEAWIRDFRIDGFRIDTMKHVNDEFWQKFAPGDPELREGAGDPRLLHVRRGRRRTSSRAASSHYTTHDDVQGVLDFPFQRRRATSRRSRAPTDELRDFFLDDDWYTDARLERLQPADVPRQPRPRAASACSSATTTRRRDRGRAARARQARARS